jgi:hypothetical protein
MAEIDRGDVELIPGDEVLARRRREYWRGSRVWVTRD